MRALKGLTFALAVCGVVAMIVASRATARPLIAISSIGPTMNFAYVRIKGVVPDYPTLSTADGYLSFYLQDATGRMHVTAYRSTVDALMARAAVPMPGDQVTVEGSLRVRDDDVSLTLNTAEALAVEYGESVAVELAALDAFPTGACATVTGQVRDVQDVTPALRRVVLRSGDTQAQMLLPLALPDVFGDSPALKPGEWVQVTGGVGEYRAQRQLLPARAEDIRVVSPPIPEVRPMSALNRRMAGRWVTVRGTVGKLRPVRDGMLLSVQDASGGSIVVAMFEPWFAVPFSQTLQVGDAVLAQGELVIYQNQLEVQPELSVDLTRGD